MTVFSASLTQYSSEATQPRALIASPRYAVSLEVGVSQKIWIVSHSDTLGLLPAGAVALDARIAIDSIPALNRSGGFESGSATISTPTFTFVDVSSSLSNWISDKNINQISTFNGILTFFEFSANDPLFSYDKPRFTGLIRDHEKPFNTVRIETSDIGRNLQEFIFTPLKWRLNSAITSEATEIPTTLALPLIPDFQATFEHTEAYIAHPNETGGYLRIPTTGEVVFYKKLEPINGIATFTGCERGQLGTIAAAVSDGFDQDPTKNPAIDEYILIEEQATEMVIGVITGRLTDGRELPAHWTARSDIKWIDTTSFAQNSSTFRLKFEGIGRHRAKDFIEKEVMQAMNALLVPNGFGRLVWTPRVLPIDESAGEIVLDESNTVTSNDIILRHVKSNVHPAVKIEYNYNNHADEFLSPVTYIDLAASNKFKIDRTKEYQFKGLHSGIHTNSQLQKLSSTFGDEYFDEILHLTIETFINGIDIGELVTVNLKNVVDDTTPNASHLFRTFMVVEATENPKTRTTTYGLRASLYTQSSRNAGQAQHNLSVEEYKRGKVSLAGLAGLTITNGIATGSITLDAGTDYYYVNEANFGEGLEFAESLNVTVTGQGDSLGLYIFGPFINKTTIDLTARSVNGGGIGATPTTDATTGARGYVMNSHCSGGLSTKATFRVSNNNRVAQYFQTGFYISDQVRPITTRGRFARAPDVALDVNDGVLGGVPTNLGGTGGAGGVLSRHQVRTPSQANEDAPIVYTEVNNYANGSNGGIGGGGIKIVSWSGGVVGSGKIILDGGDAEPSNQTGSGRIQGSRGGGGGPGSLLWIVDGNHAPPLLDSAHVIARYGDGSTVGQPVVQSQRFRTTDTLGNVYKSQFIARLSDANQFESVTRITYTPASESVESLQSIFDLVFDGDIQLYISNAQPSNGNPYDAWIRPAELDGDSSTPVFSYLHPTNGWTVFDWDNDNYRTDYAALISINRERRGSVLYEAENGVIPEGIQDGDAFRDTRTGIFYIYRSNGMHEPFIRDGTVVGDERNPDSNFTLTRDSYLTSGFIHYYSPSSIAELPLQGDPVNPAVNTNTLPPPRDVSALEFSSTTGAVNFTHPFDTSEILSYRIYLNGSPVNNTTGNSFQFPTLTPNTRYTFGVQSVGANGLVSDIITAVTTTRTIDLDEGMITSVIIRGDGGWEGFYASVAAPASGTFVDFTPTTGQLSWTPVSNAQTYLVSLDGVQIAEVTTTGLFVDSGLMANQTGVFTVMSRRTFGSNFTVSDDLVIPYAMPADAGPVAGVFEVINNGPTVEVSGTNKMRGRGLFMEFKDFNGNTVHSITRNFDNNDRMTYTPPAPSSNYSTWTGFVVDTDGIGFPLPNQPVAYNQ